MDPTNTQLLTAIKCGNIQDAKALILSGVEINCKDNYSRTPLHIAADFGFLEIVKMLIAKESMQKIPEALHLFTGLLVGGII